MRMVLRSFDMDVWDKLTRSEAWARQCGRLDAPGPPGYSCRPRECAAAGVLTGTSDSHHDPRGLSNAHGNRHDRVSSSAALP